MKRLLSYVGYILILVLVSPLAPVVIFMHMCKWIHEGQLEESPVAESTARRRRESTLESDSSVVLTA